nr:hypothetical protein [Tanacetum cinerariifolium]
MQSTTIYSRISKYGCATCACFVSSSESSSKPFIYLALYQFHLNPSFLCFVLLANSILLDCQGGKGGGGNKLMGCDFMVSFCCRGWGKGWREFEDDVQCFKLYTGDANSSSSEIAKLTHAVIQQTSAVTTAMTAILKQFQATPLLASVKAVEEICVTCGGAHPYYQCLVADGNTFLELRYNIQGYVATTAVNYNQGNFGYRPPGSGHLPRNTIANPKGELKAITTRSGIVLDGPSVPIPPLFINLEEDEHVEETLTDQDLSEYTIKLHINITLADALILIPKYQKMLKALLSNKEKLLELANTPLNENCSAIILKKLPKKLGDPGKFLIPCGFSELKCKALANPGSSINLMPLSVWKKLGLTELISTRKTFELANQAICTPTGIARDVFILVDNFTFPADFVIIDYESGPRVPLILGRPLLQTARTLIDVHGEEMILCDGDERLTLNMRNDTSSYSNQHQKESINMINIFNDSSEDFFENLFATNHQSGNPTFSSHLNLTSPEVKDDVFDPEGGNVLIEKLLDLDSTKDLHSPHNVNPLSGSTTSYTPNHLLEEFADELALITFPPEYDDDLPFDIEFDLKEIKYMLNHDPIKKMDSILKDSIDQSNLADLNDNLADTMPEMFTNEHALIFLQKIILDVLVDDDEKLLKKVDDPVNTDSDSDVQEVFNETTCIMASMSFKVDKISKNGSGVGNKSMFGKLQQRVDAMIQVLNRINDNAYKIDLPGTYNVPTTFNVADLPPYVIDTQSGEKDIGVVEQDLRVDIFQAGEYGALG